MVLGGAMKFIASLIGAVVSGIICFVVFSLVSKYQVAQIGYTPNQSDVLIDVFIIIAPLVIVLGGWLSLKMYKSYLTKSSSGR
jgi:multisubunit Na+/H+ antiporter MnhB subunit